MLKIEIPVKKGRISDAQIRQMVTTGYKSYRRKREWKKRIAAFLIFCSLIAGGRYWYQANSFNATMAPIATTGNSATDMNFGTGQYNAEAVLSTLLELIPPTSPVLKAVIQSMKTDSGDKNWDKINASSELSPDERLYFQALVHLKNKKIADAKALLMTLNDSYDIKKKALKEIQLISEQ